MPLPKGEGKGIMVSGFLTEVEGVLQKPNGQLCVEYLEIGDGRWWNSKLKENHVLNAIEAAEHRYPYALP